MAVILASAIVVVAFRAGIERYQPFEPLLIILVQPRLVVVDEDACRYVHRIYQTEPFLNSALPNAPGDVVRNI